jgi:hypothetical protein
MSHPIEEVLTQEAMCQKSFKLREASSKLFISVAFVSAVVCLADTMQCLFRR